MSLLHPRSVVRVRGLLPRAKCESKSWALPAAATNRKTKISPAPREFLAHTDFLHGLLRLIEGGSVQAPLRFARAGTHKPRSSIRLRIEDARTALLYRTGNCSRPQQASRFRMRAARYEKGGCEKPHGTLR